MYRYFVFKIFDLSRQAMLANEIPQYNSILIMSLFASLNTLTALGIIKISLSVDVSFTLAMLALIYAVIVLIHYLVYLKGKTVADLVSEYEKLTQASNSAVLTRYNAALMIYVVVSLVAFFGVATSLEGAA